ncbi:MAG: helix-hairpin-helix domain-containing protein [Gammaproteobacteria bacterium]|nr:helix-hairpin-helix domain-containing protein [Gammaproteobacteria bacterium]
MNITDISGIGDATAQRLKAHGIDSVKAVAQASIEQLVAVPGIGADRAAALRQSAIRLLPDAAGAEEADAVTGAGESDAALTPADDEAKPMKDKGGKKGRKDKKKKDKKRRRKGDKKEKKRKKKEKKRDKGRKKGKDKRK